jgi:hypothetical protein
MLVLHSNANALESTTKPFSFGFLVVYSTHAIIFHCVGGCCMGLSPRILQTLALAIKNSARSYPYGNLGKLVIPVGETLHGLESNR